MPESSDTPEIVVVERTLTYIGTREWVDSTLNHCYVPLIGEKVMPNGGRIISMTQAALPFRTSKTERV